MVPHCAFPVLQKLRHPRLTQSNPPAGGLGGLKMGSLEFLRPKREQVDFIHVKYLYLLLTRGTVGAVRGWRVEAGEKGGGGEGVSEIEREEEATYKAHPLNANPLWACTLERRRATWTLNRRGRAWRARLVLRPQMSDGLLSQSFSTARAPSSESRPAPRDFTGSCTTSGRSELPPTASPSKDTFNCTIIV